MKYESALCLYGMLARCTKQRVQINQVHAGGEFPNMTEGLMYIPLANGTSTTWLYNFPSIAHIPNKSASRLHSSLKHVGHS